MSESKKEMCPGCGKIPADDRQEDRPHLCRWCGWNHETSQPAQFVPASDPFDYLDSMFDPPPPNPHSEKVE